MDVHVKQDENGYWQLWVNGKCEMYDESHTVVSRVADALRGRPQPPGECAEVARNIQKNT